MGCSALTLLGGTDGGGGVGAMDLAWIMSRQHP